MIGLNEDEVDTVSIAEVVKIGENVDVVDRVVLVEGNTDGIKELVIGRVVD